MTDLLYVYAIAGLIGVYFAAHVLRGRFDPFAPIWLFLVGYLQVYVVQPMMYRDWALRVRGDQIVEAANLRALWALALFLAAYHVGLGKIAAKRLPRPPANWSVGVLNVLCPFLIAWGLVCVVLVMRHGVREEELSAELQLIQGFPFVMQLAGILLIVTSRQGPGRRGYLVAGVAVCTLYVMLWMFNGKRSHALMGVLTTVCAFYISKFKRPSWPVLFATGLVTVLAVAVAIGWRNNMKYERSFSGFMVFLGDFSPRTVLQCLNLEEREGDTLPTVPKSYETEEWGGFLLMLDTVPEKSGYDYGMNYLRVFSTFIPRIVWAEKPVFGREKWIQAWIVGSEFKREAWFTGPAIGLMGATQLNGGAWATAIVMPLLALFLRSLYDYFRVHAANPLVQAWWSVFFFQAWFTVLNDDPLVWFYYNWGFTTMPTLVFLWLFNKVAAPSSAHAGRFEASGSASPAPVGLSAVGNWGPAH